MSVYFILICSVFFFSPLSLSLIWSSLFVPHHNFDGDQIEMELLHRLFIVVMFARFVTNQRRVRVVRRPFTSCVCQIMRCLCVNVCALLCSCFNWHRHVIPSLGIMCVDQLVLIQLISFRNGNPESIENEDRARVIAAHSSGIASVSWMFWLFAIKYNKRKTNWVIETNH